MIQWISKLGEQARESLLLNLDDKLNNKNMFIQYSNMSNVLTLPILQYSNLSNVLTLPYLNFNFLTQYLFYNLWHFDFNAGRFGDTWFPITTSAVNIIGVFLATILGMPVQRTSGIITFDFPHRFPHWAITSLVLSWSASKAFSRLPFSIKCCQSCFTGR